LGWW